MLIGMDKEHIVTIEEVANECADETKSGITEKIFIENFKNLCDKMNIELAVFKAKNNRYCINSCFKQIIKFVMLQSVDINSLAYELLQDKEGKFHHYQSILSVPRADHNHVKLLYTFYSSMYDAVKGIPNNTGITLLYMLDKKFYISVKQHDYNIRCILNLINTMLCRTLKATIKIMGQLFDLILNILEKFVPDDEPIEGFDLIGSLLDGLTGGKNKNFYMNNVDGAKLPDSYQKWTIDFLLDNVLLLLDKYDDYMVCVDIMSNIENIIYDFYLAEMENRSLNTKTVEVEFSWTLLTNEEMHTAHRASKDMESIYKILCYKMKENQQTKNSSLTLKEMLAYQKAAPDFVRDIASRPTQGLKICGKLKDIREIEKEISQLNNS